MRQVPPLPHLTAIPWIRNPPAFFGLSPRALISRWFLHGAVPVQSAIGWQTAIVGLVPSNQPVAFSQTVTTEQDTPVSITLTATSPQGFPLTYTVLTQPTHGTLSGSAPNLTYTPNAGYVGPDSFTFKANDGTTDSNTATVSITVRGLAPFIVSSVGYDNSTPLTAHTSNAFNSTGASTLVAFVSSHPAWPWPGGAPVSISGLSDNLGNTWNLLTGPTLFSGSSFTLMSAIYYVNSPATSITHTVTAQLTNPAPLVLHVFAVSGSDITGPPISSAITDPGPGGASANVITAPISVPTDSLLLSWVKNETGATASALNGFTLDSQSTSFLWAESETPISAGSYTGDFQYDSAIGWQTAIVGVKPHSPVPPTPVITSTPSNPTNETSASFSFTDTEAGVSFFCQLDGSAFSPCSSPATYSGLSLGNHTFSVKVQDNAGNQSAAASFSWTIGVQPTVSSVSPNSGPAAGGTTVTITGANFAAGATVTFGGAAATNVVVVSGTQITATTPAGSAGAATVTVTGERSERKLDEWVYLHCSAGGERCIAEQWVNDGRDSGDDHGDELCRRGDGDVWRGGSNECSDRERDEDHGDDAGACGGGGDGDGNGEWAERKLDQWVHLQPGGGDPPCPGGGGHAAVTDGNGFCDVSGCTDGGKPERGGGGVERHCLNGAVGAG